jgi:HemY protein
LAEGGHFRKANRIIDSAWRANPHPELAQAYAELRSGESARDRLKRIEAGARRVPGHIEGALAVARAALDAQEFAKARSELSPYLDRPTKRVCVLMAKLERAERSDEGRAREWMARALNAPPDPQWTADGYVSDRWLPVSPVSGRIDAFVWRVPLTGAIAAPIIEPELPFAVTAAPPRDQNAVIHAEPAGGRPAPAPVKAEPVIPLVHAPDDPGPEGIEQSETPADQNGGWRKIFQ